MSGIIDRLAWIALGAVASWSWWTRGYRVLASNDEWSALFARAVLAFKRLEADMAAERLREAERVDDELRAER